MTGQDTQALHIGPYITDGDDGGGDCGDDDDDGDDDAIITIIKFHNYDKISLC